MRGFLVDEDLSRSMVLALRESRYDAIHVRDAGLRGQPDPAIFRYARDHEYIVVTADRGFADVLTFQPTIHAGIIVLRVPGGFSMSALNELLLWSLEQLADTDLKDALIIVEPGRIRIRRGPPRG